MRKTKIACTLGPSVDSEEMMRRLILGGMDSVRINAAHGTHGDHLALLNKFKRVRAELGRPVATILDAGGPEIRIRTFANGPVMLEKGAQFILTTEDVPGDETRVSVTYADLHRELTEGCHVLLDDGLVELTVSRVEGRNIVCTVENGGELSNSKSVNIPGVSISLPYLSEKDKQDIQFAVEQEFDFLMISFVRRASDVADVRAELKRCGGEKVRILAKIENREGINNLDEIIAAADGVVVARGDLGVEIPVCEVPVVQKEITWRAAARGKDVIITTQMLDSMMRNPRPTRAEVSDVANAVYDGASCVMLTGETASGKYPMEALNTLVDTVTAAEEAMDRWAQFRNKSPLPGGSTNRIKAQVVDESDS